MRRWLDALNRCVAQDVPYVMVSVIAVKGSAPRDVGARMIVTYNSCDDTIGGGKLEHEAIVAARTILSQKKTQTEITTDVRLLGPDLEQCCGGQVTLQYEYQPGSLFRLYLFGAGHVGQAVAKIASELPCHLTVVDSRQSWLDQLSDSAGITVTKLDDENRAFSFVEQCMDNAYFLVMTHSHELDFDLLESILTRGDSQYCGLIASQSKANRFKSRLRKKGFSATELDLLTSPIGENVARSDHPMEIAVAVCAELLLQRQAKTLVS